MWYIFTFIAGFIFCFASIFFLGDKVASYLDGLVEKRKNGE